MHPIGAPTTDSRLGAWIISLGNATNKGDAPVKDDLDTICLSAKAARFFSAIRSLPRVNAQQLEAYREEADLRRHELTAVIEHLVNQGVADTARDDSGKLTISAIRHLGVPGVYDFAASFYRIQERNERSDVALGVLDATMLIPIHVDRIIQAMTSQFSLTEDTVLIVLKHLQIVGAVSISLETDAGQAIVYNPLNATNTNEDGLKALAGLGSRKRDEVLTIVEHIKKHPGVPIPEELRGSTYDVLKSIGIVDASTYAPKHGERLHEFPTLQATWGRVTFSDASVTSDDLVHDAKALLASIRYGEHFASVSGGRIWSPFALLRKLLSQGIVGPATNIGTDYPLIARRGIINIVENPNYVGRYSMELVKSDVVEPVLELLRNETTVNVDDFADEIASGSYSFKAPEESRRQQLTGQVLALRDEIMFSQLLRKRWSDQ